MNVILIIASGNNGPIRAAVADSDTIVNTILQLQAGNPVTLELTDIVAGGDLMHDILADRLPAHTRVLGAWHQPAALKQLGTDLPSARAGDPVLQQLLDQARAELAQERA